VIGLCGRSAPPKSRAAKLKLAACQRMRNSKRGAGLKGAHPDSQTGDRDVQLRPDAVSRIRSAEAAAEGRLDNSLRRFLSSWMSDRASGKEHKHILSRSDLLPFFVEYAIAVFNAEAHEYIEEAKKSEVLDIAAETSRLDAISRNLVKRIASKRNGVWQRTVEEACKYVGMGTAELGMWWCSHGTFTVGGLMRSQPIRLRSALRVRRKHWESRLHRLAAERPARTFVQAAKERLKKAQGQLTVKNFASKIGVSVTFIYALQRGELRGNTQRLAKVAEAVGCKPDDLWRKEYASKRKGSGAAL